MRPHVICHMVTSIDGRIIASRWGKMPGGQGAAGLFETTADSFGVGAWVVGTTTMKEFAAGVGTRLKRAAGPVSAGDFVADPKAERLAIGTDAKGVLRFKSGDVDGDHVVLLVTERGASADYRAHLRAAGASYLVCGRSTVDLPTAMTKLRAAFGLRKLMLEGGGTFNGAMLAAGLVDEVSQVIVPVVDGGVGVPGMFDVPGGPGKSAVAKLRVTKRAVLPGGVTWVRYKVTGKIAGKG